MLPKKLTKVLISCASDNDYGEIDMNKTYMAGPGTLPPSPNPGPPTRPTPTIHLQSMTPLMVPIPPRPVACYLDERR